MKGKQMQARVFFYLCFIFTLSFNVFAKNIITYPHLFKQSRLSKPILENMDVKEGLYRFDIRAQGYNSSISLLVISEDRYPGFKSNYGIIQTPVTFAVIIPNKYKFSPYNLGFISQPINNEGTEFHINDNRDIFGGFIIKLNMDDETQGEFFVKSKGEAKKIGRVRLKKFMDLSQINMEYSEYNANLKKLNVPEEWSKVVDPEKIETCLSKDYQGKFGFLSIPKELSASANGWMMAALLDNGKCSINLTQHAIGAINQTELLGINGEFQLNLEEGAPLDSLGDNYPFLSINGKPGKTNMQAILKLDNLYEESKDTLIFEMSKN